MRYVRALPFLAAALVLVVGCKSKGSLDGHVTLSNKPVGSAQVRAIPAADIAAYLDTKRPAAAAELAALRREVEDAGRAMNGAANQISDLNRPAPASGGASGGVLVTAPGAGGIATYLYDPSKMDGGEAEVLARQALADAKRRDEIAAQEAAKKQAALQPGLSSQVGAQRDRQRVAYEKLFAWEADVWSDLPTIVSTAAISAVGDAKGGFVLELPSRGRFALIVEGSRVDNGVTRRRSWGVWVDLEGQPRKEIQLTESNALSADSADSLLK